MKMFAGLGWRSSLWRWFLFIGALSLLVISGAIVILILLIVAWCFMTTPAPPSITTNEKSDSDTKVFVNTSRFFTLLSGVKNELTNRGGAAVMLIYYLGQSAFWIAFVEPIRWALKPRNYAHNGPKEDANPQADKRFFG